MAFETRRQAAAAGRKLAAEVRRAEPKRRWKHRTHLNIGWHVNVVSEDMVWYVFKTAGAYHAGICHPTENPAMRWTSHARTLRAVFRKVRERARSEAPAYEAIAKLARTA